MWSTRTWQTRAILWLAAGVVCVAPFRARAAAQQSAGAAPELIDAILRNVYRFEGGNVRLLNGRVPEDLEPNFYVPPGTRVLGSVVMGSSVRVFATSSTPIDSLRAVYTRALAPAGWSPFMWPDRGGFVESRRERPIIFCREGAQLRIEQQRRDGASYDLVLDYRDSMDSCGSPRAGAVEAVASASATSGVSASAVRLVPVGEPRFPTLYAPEDLSGSARARCFTRGGPYRGEMRTSTFVPATMSAAALLAHYATQLEAAGWRASPTAAREAAVGTWTLADTSGVKDLKLQVVEMGTPDARCYDVQMGVSARSR